MRALYKWLTGIAAGVWWFCKETIKSWFFDHVIHFVEPPPMNMAKIVEYGPPAIFAALCLVLICWDIWDRRREKPVSAFSDHAAKVYPHLVPKPWWKKIFEVDRHKNSRTQLRDLVSNVYSATQQFDLQAFFAELRQAGSDGTLTYFGRRHRYNSDELNMKEPLIAVPQSHWVDFHIEPTDLFHWTNQGNIQSVHQDNARAYTTNHARDRKSETFIDLHVNSGEAIEFLKRYVSKP